MRFLWQITRLAGALIAISLFCGQIQVAFADFDCNTVSEIPVSECEALVSLYNSAGGAAWSNSDDWLISNTPCSWYKISCSAGHVTSIFVNSNQLIGSIPPELGNLAKLKYLYLSSNQLTGSIPSELGNLAGLVTLSLYSNQLTGSIPPELGKLAGLQSLRLNSNQLTGRIPLELDKLTSLKSLYLYSNQLTGRIPPGLGKLTSLQSLSLRSNQLTGSIPVELMNLTSLSYLSICNNHLYTSDPDLRDFLNSLQPDWESCQTPPFFIALPGIPVLLLWK